MLGVPSPGPVVCDNNDCDVILLMVPLRKDDDGVYIQCPRCSFKYYNKK